MRKGRDPQSRPYSSFGIGVDRKHALKWLFPQEKATFHRAQKVYVYSETALKTQRKTTQPAVHFLELRHVEDQRLESARDELVLQFRVAIRDQHTIVNAHAVGSVALFHGHSDQFKFAEPR